MARCLIIGCGCRGRALAERLRGGGHAVRATTRDPARLAELEAAGVEAVLGDPDRISTIAPAFDRVSVVIVLLGSASGEPDELAALHGSRLEMLLTKMLDTTVRGIVYERVGTVAPELLDGGAEIVRRACEASLIPYRLLEADPGELQPWLASAEAAVAEILTG